MAINSRRSLMLIGAVIGLSGFALLAACEGITTAMAVWLMFWGNAIQENVDKPEFQHFLQNDEAVQGGQAEG